MSGLKRPDKYLFNNLMVKLQSQNGAYIRYTLMVSDCFNSKRSLSGSKNETQKIKGKYRVQKKKAYIHRNPKMKKKKKRFKIKEESNNLEQKYIYSMQLSKAHIIYRYTQNQKRYQK